MTDNEQEIIKLLRVISAKLDIANKHLAEDQINT
jgi:hypothetical protein